MTALGEPRTAGRARAAKRLAEPVEVHVARDGDALPADVASEPLIMPLALIDVQPSNDDVAAGGRRRDRASLRQNVCAKRAFFGKKLEAFRHFARGIGRAEPGDQVEGSESPDFAPNEAQDAEPRKPLGGWQRAAAIQAEIYELNSSGRHPSQELLAERAVMGDVAADTSAAPACMIMARSRYTLVHADRTSGTKAPPSPSVIAHNSASSTII